METLDGEEWSLSDFRGKTVVLNFWATWCGPCRTEIPAFTEFAEENPDIPVLGIAMDGDQPAKLRRAVKQLGIGYPVLLADNDVKQKYKVSTLPTTVVVDKDGQVKDIHVGAMFKPQLEWAVR